MRALLERQQQKHRAAAAMGDILVRRSQQQQQQQQSLALRWQWSETNSKLRRQEQALTFSLQQVLSSEALQAVSCIADDAEEYTSTAKQIGTEGATATHGATNAAAADVVTPGDLQSSNVKSRADAAGGSATSKTLAAGRPFGRFAATLHRISFVLHSLKQLNLAARSNCTSIKDTVATAAAANLSAHEGSLIESETEKELPPQTEPTQEDHRQLLLMAGCIFQSVAATLKEEAISLERSWKAAATEAAAATSTLRELQLLPQTCVTPLGLQRQQQQQQGDPQSLTDTEDAIFRGEAPEVRAAAAADELEFASRRSSTSRAMNKKEPKVANSSHEEITALPKSSSTATVRQRQAPADAPWQQLLEEYGLRLLQLEQKHAQELEECQRQILLHKKALYKAASGIVHRSMMQQQHHNRKSKLESWLEESIVTEAEVKSQYGSCGKFSLQTPAGAEGTSPKLIQNEEKDIDFDAKEVCTDDWHTAAELTAAPEEGSGGCATGTIASTAERDAVAEVLFTVRWLSSVALAERDGDEAQLACLCNRLQLAFPTAAEKDLKAILNAQQQLSLANQRQVTCVRVWTSARQQELSLVIQGLNALTSRCRDTIERNRVAQKLRERGLKLSKQLEQHKKRKEEERSRLAAAEKAAKEAEVARQLKNAIRERSRREKDKICIEEFRQRKLLESKQLQERKAAKQQAALAAETPQIKLLKAARVARRQEQHRLRALVIQLERQEQKLQEELMRQRLLAVADKLKPAAEKDPSRLHQPTASSQSYTQCGEQQRQQRDQQMQQRLASFGVDATYSSDALMKDLRFRFSTELAECHLANTKPAQDLLMKMSRREEPKDKPLSF
ncbi:hypothetical protein, conserved [Eimeria necatrix]|uniref:Uncharacterized protein n=1 Tax=Eimeria necatrix TaxID=51315 RepID=U6MHL6_9EIME|nr:hypothetical protein, conserved [Eimeria necatrix]CDJ63747.1 hypothetical protein, conserved [Eimeria necatrix]